MFTVGEFSQLAQVSKRLLRYYDEIGLLKPSHTDKFTNRRYYSAGQMPLLNRILALKDLDLSLGQIRRLLHDEITTDEMQGMLLMKKVEIEQKLQEELQRIRHIEARMQFLRSTEEDEPFDVVIKQIPAKPVLSVRTQVESSEAGWSLFSQLMTALPERSGTGLFFTLLHSDGLDESNLDVEIGRMIETKSHVPVALSGGLQLCYHELPAVTEMATYVAQGSNANLLIAYSAIASWAEANGYRFAGTPREVALQLPQSPDWGDAVAEIQYPVEPVRQT